MAGRADADGGHLRWVPAVVVAIALFALRVNFLVKQRDEERYDNLADLTAQIARSFGTEVSLLGLALSALAVLVFTQGLGIPIPAIRWSL